MPRTENPVADQKPRWKDHPKTDLADTYPKRTIPNRIVMRQEKIFVTPKKAIWAMR